MHTQALIAAEKQTLKLRGPVAGIIAQVESLDRINAEAKAGIAEVFSLQEAMERAYKAQVCVCACVCVRLCVGVCMCVESELTGGHGARI